MSASARISSICSRFDIASVTRPSSAISRSRIRSTDLSSTHTSACIPRAMIAELRPTTPPPRITTLAGGTPGTPPSRMPRPPCAFSSDQAPICGASRPATSLIGASSGRWRLGVSTVSYAIPVMPDAEQRVRQRLVGGDVQVREQRQILAEPGVLLCDRLLHLQQELRRAPHLVDRGDPRADRGVGVVGEARADAGVLLDGDLVAVLHELERACGREGDAILALLDLPGNSDPHRGRTIQERQRRPLPPPPSDAAPAAVTTSVRTAPLSLPALIHRRRGRHVARTATTTRLAKQEIVRNERTSSARESPGGRHPSCRKCDVLSTGASPFRTGESCDRAASYAPASRSTSRRSSGPNGGPSRPRRSRSPAPASTSRGSRDRRADRRDTT